MATLRDPLFGLNNAPNAEWQAAEIEAQRPNSLRGGWESGRIGTEVNALNADISSLRAQGDTARADGLQREADALRQQQANVAPRIGRLEDINGVGDALSWAAGQMGQGTASMVEPVAAATAIGGVGALMGMAPGGIGAAGRALRNFGAPAAAYGLNQRQLKGEFYGEASRDAELMARTSPQDLNNTAEMYGAGAALLDTAPHALLGRMFTGGLRKGLGGMGVGAATALGMGGEGLTEAAQNYGSQQTRGYLNPNRDTSGDFMENVNAGAGGFVGSGPMSAGGAMANAGYHRVGVTADQIGAKTGEMMDLAREKYEGSALQGGVDKALSAGKQKAGDLMDLARDDDGNISLTRLAEAAGAARDSVQDGAQDLVQRYKVSAEERAILEAAPPQGLEQDPEKYAAWFAETSGKRTNFVAQRLDEMAENDPAAADLFDRLVGETDPAAQQAVAEEGASYILQNNEIEQERTRAKRVAAAAGEFAVKGAGAVGKGAVVAGKAAAKFGKAMYDGAAGEMRKQNKQGGITTTPYDEWVQRRDQMRAGALPIEEQGERRAAANRVLDAEAIRRDPKKAEAMERSRRRAELFGEILEAEARSARAVFATRADPAVEDAFGLITRHAGYELADIADSWGLREGAAKPGLNAGTRQSRVLTMALDRITNSMRIALRDRAAPVIDELQAQAEPQAAPLFDYVRERLTASATPAGRKAIAATRSNIANEMMMLVPDARRAEIMGSEAEGGKLSRAWLLESVEALANGHESPKFRAALDEAFGKDVVSQMIGMVSDVLPAPPKLIYGVDYGGEESLVAATVNEDGEYEGETTAEGMTAFEQRQAEKKVAKGSGSKVYGFYRGGLSSLRGSTDQRDPFAPLTKTSKGATPDRPALFGLADGLSDALAASTPGGLLIDDGMGGQRRMTAIEKKIADMEKSLEAAGGYVVGKQSAHDVMKDLGFQPGKILSVYRDYLAQDASKKGMDPAAKSALLDKAARVAGAVLDAVEQGGERKVFRVPAGERKQLLNDAKEYFKERYVAVAERPSNRDPSRIETTEMLNMARAGARVVEFARGKGAEATKKARQDGTSSEAVAEGKGKDVERALLDDANLITFQSDLMGTKNRGLHIRAGTLVAWQRAARAQSQEQGKAKAKAKAKGDEYSNADKNQAFLDDLLEGITAVMTSGLVDEKLPTRINAQGNFESFAKGIPPSLRLVTSTYGDTQWGKKERLEGITRRDPIAGPPNKNDPSRDATRDGDYQTEVALDQARNEEFFVADDLEGVEPPAAYLAVQEAADPSVGTAGRRRKTMYADRPTFSTGSRVRKGPELDGAGNVVRPAPYTGEAADSKKERDALEAQYEEERKAREERSDAAGKFAGESPEQRDVRRARLAESERSRVAERSVQSAARARALGTADPKAGADREYQPPARTFPNKAAADAAAALEAAREAELEINLDMYDDSSKLPRSGNKATPLDFYPEQESGAVPDEFADQQFRTTNKATDLAVGPEPKMSAMKEAPERAAAIVKTLRKDFAAGVAMLESRLRTAQRPEFIKRPKGQKPGAPDMRGAEGGVHYIFPVAHALGLDTIASLDLGPAEARQLQALRAETAAVILAAPKLSDARKIALTRAMAPAASASKVTVANYAKLLGKAAAAAQGVSDVGSVPSAFSPEQKDISRKPLVPTKREDGRLTKEQLYNNPEARVDGQTDMFRETYDPRARALPPKALVRTRKYAEKFDGDVDQMSAAIARKAAGVSHATPAAPEVAAAGVPKSQPKPSGGRDLGTLPMHYKMPPHGVRQDLRAQYPNGTTTAQLMADGHRTATTRRAFGAVGDTFTVAGREYRITALERVDMDSAAGREKWAQREGWDVDYIQQHGSGQVRTGAVQTVFERVGAVNVWHSTGENAQLSNLAARPFTLGGKQFHSVEHAYQSWKSGEFDQGTYDRYTGAGRKIAGTKGTKTKNDWSLRMMKRFMEESFRQNPDAAQALLATGDAPITHTQDRGVWAKEFPRILTEVRAELAEGRTAPAEFTNHSGGALGADSMFDKVGRSLGFTKHNHYYHGNKTPTGNVALTQSQVDEGIVHAKRAAAVLARPWNDKYASLLGRNWFQVKNASQVIAVAPLIEPGELNEKGYASKAKRTTVGGGTGYAVEMAIANSKEVHVFDTKSNRWFAWDGQGFVESGVPALAKDYAGIGSRQDYGRMTPESVQAIRDVFEKALAPKTGLRASTKLHSRLGPITDKIVPDQGPNGDVIDAAVRAITKTALAMRAMGVTRKDVMDSKVIANDLAILTSLKLQGDPDVQRGIDKALMRIDQVFAQEPDKGIEGDISFALKGAGVRGVPLRSIMDMIAASRFPESAKAVARAVKKVAGHIPVRTEAMDLGMGGYFSPEEGRIALSDERNTGLLATTALHEGAHAATVSAVMANPGLHAALYRLMSHVVASDPRIAQAYGLSTTLEFLAEGLSNINLQRRLHKIPANAAVEKYLGRNVADAWSAFVELVRQALNLPQGSETALTQFLELSGMAMKGTAKRGTTVSVGTSNEFLNRRVVPLKEVQPYVDAIADSPYLEEGARNEVREGIVEYASSGVVGVPHYLALAVALVAKSMRSAASAYGGKMSASQLNEVLRNAASAMSGPSFRTPSWIGSDADWADTGARKLNAQVGATMAASREIMRGLGFKAAPPQFADVAAKLLTDPNVDPAKFVHESAEGLSHLLMEGKSGEQIRTALRREVWFPQRAKIAARLVQGGMKRGDALVESYREITRAALAQELVARSQAEKSFVGTIKQLAKDFMSRFKEVTDRAEFADLVRNNLNDLIAKAKGPIDLKANFTKVSFQGAVDGDPVAARVLAHMSTDPNIAITGSIVLAHNGPIYRNAANMLHDLDFVVKSTKEAAEAHLRKAFPGAVQVYDFTASKVKVDSFLVPPADATIENIVREYGEKGKVMSFDVVKDGKVIGRTWNDKDGEHKSGISGTFVDLFTGSKQEVVTAIPFTVDGKPHSVGAVSFGSIFDEKLSMGRSKDLTDYLWFEPTSGRKLNRQASEIHNDLKREGFAATHDSPTRHDGKFDWRSYAGTGEGQAAFGEGSYVSTDEGVHRNYKKMFSSGVSDNVLQDALDEVRGELEAEDLESLGAAGIREAVEEYLRESLDPVDSHTNEGIYRALRALKNTPDTTLLGMKSPTYQVSINIKPEELLDWDKPLSEQSGLVRKRLESSAVIQKWRAVNEDMADFDLLPDEELRTEFNPAGKAVYAHLTRELGSQAKASEYLQSLGILGHRYAASGGKNDAYPNYVIYDDSKITTNYVHFNAQDGNARVATQAEMDAAKAYVKKVLGPQIKVEFKDLTGYSGEWLDAEQAIHISTTAAAGTLSTVYHEALHGFFSKFVKSDPRVKETLKSLAENDKILGRLAALLAKHPAALEQLKSGEERLAYIYQFWAAGKLDLPMGKPRTVLQKVRKFFRRVLGLVKDSERAVALFEAFHEGELAQPSAAGRVIAGILDEGTGVLKARRKMDGVAQWLAAKTMPAETILATSESKAAQALAKEFFTNPGDGSVGKEAEGYLNARRSMASRYNNTFARATQGLSARDMTEVAGYLQQEAELSDIDYAPHREAVSKIRNLLQRFYRYMSDERGLELGHAGDKYYPRVWNTALLHQKKDQFVAMLTEHYGAVLAQGAQGSKGRLSEEQVAERIWRALIDREGVNDKFDAQRQDGVLAPFFASKENRTLEWLQGEHAEPFLEKSLVGTLSRYFHQGVRAAEYTARFGADGEHLEGRLMEVHNELVEISHTRAKRKEFKDDAARAKWVKRQYRDVAEAVGAMEGTLGKDISPGMRKLNSWTTVYQNVRLLPLSLFSSFVDPLGMVARGATMKEAYDGFLRGMKEVVRTWGDMFREEPKERQADQWERLAEHVGAVDAAMFSHHVSDEYSSVYMVRGAKKINDAMFKLNGMEAWNRGMRVAGTKSAVKFIERHSALPDRAHSARWLEELGLDPKNIPLDSEGNLITDKSVLISEKGMGKAQAEREIDAVYYAINRWVEGAILTPNAAQRPAWGSDPHYSMFFHLKQFSYSFHQTIIKRAVNEMNHGNLAPLGVFAWYIPAMIAADIAKGLIQGGGELPAYMKAYDAGDWVMHGVQRAGVLGVGTMGVDAQADVFSLAGPAVEQMVDAMVDPLERTLLKAAPAHGLYAEAFR